FVEPWSLDAKRRFSQEIASFHRTTQNTRILEPRQGRRQFDHLVLRPYQFERCSIPYPRGPIFAKWKAVAAPPKVHKPRSIHRQALFARHKKARTDPVRAFFAERRSADALPQYFKGKRGRFRHASARSRNRDGIRAGLGRPRNCQIEVRSA